MASSPPTHSNGENISEIEIARVNHPPPTTQVAMNGVQNGVHTNPNNGRLAEDKQQAYRSWLLLLTSLTATVTFTVGLTPPGGFWAADDKTNGYVAGISVMRDKFPTRYLAFYYSNTTAFFTSLMIIAMLAKNQNSENTNSEQPDAMKKHVLNGLVVLCFLSLGTSYVAGTWDSPSRVIYVVAVFVVNISYMLLPWFVSLIRRCIRSRKP
ncbi:uncharacterized protein LOC119320423 [Triticum dicoccoides]|uniref:uncharacterized protein LOC119320423 n=1 Tax=Triticum dicoccoides TaxID=85692 RepID=UPI00189101E4|nr:uncharacterized protein LOC119320423 [Triticum dicoccoides]